MTRIISVCHTREGLNNCFLGINLAIALMSQSKEKAAVVDFSFSGGNTIGALVNVKSIRSLGEIVPMLSKLDDKLLKGYLTTHSSGIGLLGGTSRESKKTFEPAVLGKVINTLARAYPFIIIVAPEDPDEHLASVLDISDIAFLTAAPHILSLADINAFMETVKSWHFPANMVKPVLSKIASAQTLSHEQINDYTGTSVFAEITFEPEVIFSSINSGNPAVISHAYSAMSKDIRKAAGQLLEQKTFSEIDKSQRSAPRPAAEEIQPADETQVSVKNKYRQLKQKIHNDVASHPELKNLDLKSISNPEVMADAREKARKIIQDILSAQDQLTREERSKFVDELLDEILGLGCLEEFLKNPDITEIMVNARDKIYIEKKGKIQQTDAEFTSDKQLRTVIDRIVSPIGRRVDESSPLVDARLSDGSRVNAIIPPISLEGPSITIRKFSKKKLTTDDLVQFGALTPHMAEFLEVCVQLRKNIVISGGTGSGKTTLLNIVSSFIPSDERIVTIEDSAELKLPQEHVVRLESRPASVEGTGEVNIRRLVINALRMRPDRIVVGECRGGETLDMLQAMNTGHDGSLTTIHANSPKDGIARITTMVIMAGTELPERAIREQICSAVQVIVQLSRLSDGTRKVTEISEILGIKNDAVEISSLFKYEQTGIKDGKVQGNFLATGNIPTFYDEIAIHGLSVDKNIFKSKGNINGKQ